MKKTAALLLTVLLCLPAFQPPSLAAGRLSVVQENQYSVFKYDRWYSYYFAKVENSGNRPVSLYEIQFEYFDAGGDVLTSERSIGSQELAPGEYAYLIQRAQAASPEDAGEWQLTVLGRSRRSDMIRLDCGAEFLENVQDGYYVFHYVLVSLTNDTAFALDHIDVYIALLDGEGNLLYAAKNDVDGVLPPGARTTIRVRVDPAFARYMEEHHLTVDAADAVVFAEFSASDDEI